MKMLSGNLQKRRNRLIEEKEAQLENIDFKMVTFTLGGKDYGIDIMKVKEIAKFINFTYVPNTPPFVRGVYNLRGEIISIIDLREMFNIPSQRKRDDEEENGLILRLSNNMIGVVVDKIDKVVGISKSSIQPPHPIFGDINIKYISGVVENEGRLYIILDVERILGHSEDQKKETSAASEVRGTGLAPSASVSGDSRGTEPEASRAPQKAQEAIKKPSKDPDEINRQFIAETLESFMGFYVSDINDAWFRSRFVEWKKERGAQDLQLESEADAIQYMRGFSSAYSGRLWEKDLVDALSDSLPGSADTQLHIWNPGCGKGYESYSLAVLLRKKYPQTRIKIWASDKDLLSVSGAPNLVFKSSEVPDIYRDFMVEGPQGLSFNQEIKDSILFEYHDIAHVHTMPPIHLLVARDLLSYLTPEHARELLEDLDERMKAGGMVILGDNEQFPSGLPWKAHTEQGLRFYKK